MNAIDLILQAGKAITKNEARRLIVQGGLKINDRLVVTNEGDNVHNLEVDVQPGTKVQIGKHVLRWGA